MIPDLQNAILSGLALLGAALLALALVTLMDYLFPKKRDKNA